MFRYFVKYDTVLSDKNHSPRYAGDVKGYTDYTPRFVGETIVIQDAAYHVKEVIWAGAYDYDVFLTPAK